MFTSSGFPLLIGVYSINSSKMIGNFFAILIFNRLFLKLNWFICNELSVFPDHCPRGDKSTWMKDIYWCRVVESFWCYEQAMCGHRLSQSTLSIHPGSSNGLNKPRWYCPVDNTTCCSAGWAWLKKLASSSLLLCVFTQT